MNSCDDQLNRLLRAARNGAAPTPVREISFMPPFGLETRVLAAWRAAGGAGEIWSTGLLVRGLLLASLLMALSLLPVLDQKTNPASDYLRLADSTLQMEQSP